MPWITPGCLSSETRGNSCIKLYHFNFENVLYRSSDYPNQCVEEIFGECGDNHIFHLFMKKSMNISTNGTGNFTERKIDEVCVTTQKEGKIYIEFIF